MRLLSEDVESRLLLEELSLEAAAAYRGRQILPGQPGARLTRRLELAGTTARAKAGPHTCRHRTQDDSHTTRSSHATHEYQVVNISAVVVVVVRLASRPKLTTHVVLSSCCMRISSTRDCVNTIILSGHQNQKCLGAGDIESRGYRNLLAGLANRVGDHW